MYGFLLAQSLSNMAIGIFTLRQQLRGLLSGNWPNAKTPYVEYLVVGGGGSSGGGLGGGGGAGGVLQGILPVTPGVSYVTTVGSGGASPSSGLGNNGVNSVLSSVTALGGGGGGYWASGSAASGASGGGSGASNGGAVTGGQGVFGQGNAGGTVTGTYTTQIVGGGGGGAGTAGQGGSILSAAGLSGGAGIASAILGNVYTWGGGGGGFGYGNTVSGGNGGVGGGGGGGGNPGTGGTGGTGYNTGGTGSSGGFNGGNGGANSGGGGGGVSQTNGGTGGNGGSGIVIISYPDNYAALTTTSNLGNAYTTGSGSWSFGNTSGTRVVYGAGYSSAWSLGGIGSDYTIEAFVNLQSSTANPAAILSTSSWALSAGVATNSTNFTLSGVPYASSVNLTYNGYNWSHIAVMRSGGTTYIFVNGVQGFAINTNFNLNTSAELVVGDVVALGNNWDGYLSNIRIVKGTALYPFGSTGSQIFTPPTAPLTPVTNTTLLLSTVSGSPYTDSSVTSAIPSSALSVAPSWQYRSPFATGLGYKNRVYTWTSTGSFTV
jgi:hypothetical protein